MVDTETNEKFIELRAAGLSFDRIAKELNISKPTAIKMSRKLRAQIEQLQFINLEAMAERYKALKQERIQTLGKMLEKVDTALEAADFAKIHPERLVDLKLKLADRIQAEFSDSFTVERGNISMVFENDSGSDYKLKID